MATPTTIEAGRAPIAAAKASGAKKRAGYWSGVWRRLRRDRVTMTVAAILLLIVLASIFAPWVALSDPYAGNILARLKPIGTPHHWLGTDETGRDLWARLVYGGRMSLIGGVAPVTLALMIGGFLGIFAGYAGGIVNTIIMRAADIFYAFPSILLAIAICGFLGSGLFNSVLALAVVFVPSLIRISESVTTQTRSLLFVDAARASGTTTLQIIRHHILNNVLGTILVYATSLISLSIILSAGLSFLGLGIAPPTAEWGSMLNAMRQAIYVQPLVAALPGVMIFVTSICFNLVSDGLRSAMDLRIDYAAVDKKR